MAKQIKGSDIIEPRHLEEAVQQAVMLKNAYLELDKQVKATSTSLKNVVKGVTGGNVSEIKLITQAFKESNEAKKASINVTQQLRLAEDEEVKAKLRLQQVTAIQKKLLTEEIALENKQIGTLQKLAIENNKLRRERDGLNLETKKGSDRLKEINAQLDRNNKIIRDSGDAMKKQKLNVGNYAGAVNKLSSALGQLGIAFSAFSIASNVFKTVVGFEKATASLSSITGATGKDLDNLKGKILDLATAQKVSVTETTKLFEIVGSQMPQLLQDADGLKAVAESAIILSKASGDTIENSTLAMASVMNQFSLEATEANRVMNVLAAGSLVGSAGINDVAEAMKNVGSVSAGANVSVEETVALIEVLGKFGLTGAEAGTKLRGSILKLQQAGVGYASGQFEINDALEEAKQQMAGLGTQMEKDAFLQKMFGAENIATGRILLGNTALFEEYTKGVTGTSVATQQASVNSDTMATVINELKASWENLVVKWSEGTDVLGGAKTVLRFVADNLETIITYVVKAVTVWGSYRLALMLWNKEGNGVVQNLIKMGSAMLNAGKSAGSFGQAIKSVGFAGWVGILTAVVPLLWDMGKALWESFNRTTALEKVTEKLNVRMDEEKAKMDVLLTKIKATTAGSKERQEVINEINGTYGTTLQNIADEVEFMTQLEIAYRGVVAQMERKIKAQIIEEELLELYKQQREALKTIKELESAPGSFGVSSLVDASKIKLAEINQDIAELNKELFTTNKELGSEGKSGGGLPVKVRNTANEIENLGDNTKKTTEDLKDMRTEIEKMDVDRLYPEEKRMQGADVSQFDPKDNWFVDAMVTANEELIKAEQEAMERRKKLAQESIDLMRKITDALVEEIDKRIAKENEQLQESEKTEDYLRDLAKMGNKDASESIKAEQIAQAKQLLEIERLEKKKRNLLILTTALESASQKINSGDSKAFANAGSEIAEFIAKLPKFYQGSETTIAEALGRPQLSGKDGYIVRVDGSEKVLNPEQSAMTGTMTTDEIAKASVMYRNNQIISGKVMGYSSTSSDERIVNRLYAVEKAIKNIDIPEHRFNFDEQAKMFTETIKTKNRLLKNHQKIGGLFS